MKLSGFYGECDVVLKRDGRVLYTDANLAHWHHAGTVTRCDALWLAAPQGTTTTLYRTRRAAVLAVATYYQAKLVTASRFGEKP